GRRYARRHPCSPRRPTFRDLSRSLPLYPRASRRRSPSPSLSDLSSTRARHAAPPGVGEVTACGATPHTEAPQAIIRRRAPRRVVSLQRAGNSVACKTGIMPPFHHHERGQRNGIPPLVLPVGAVGSALAVLHVACGLAQQAPRSPPEPPPASPTTPQAPPCPEALSWPHPQAPLRRV